MFAFLYPVAYLFEWIVITYLNEFSFGVALKPDKMKSVFMGKGKDLLPSCAGEKKKKTLSDNSLVSYCFGKRRIGRGLTFTQLRLYLTDCLAIEFW